MRNRTSGWMHSTLGLVALLTVLGLVLAACGGEEASEPEGGGQNNGAGGQQAQVDLRPFPPAPQEAGNPRLRGSQEMTYEEFVQYVVNDASAKWQGTLANAGYE